jgi:hypothetical protein
VSVHCHRRPRNGFRLHHQRPNFPHVKKQPRRKGAIWCSLGRETFPQSDNLGAQFFAGKLPLQADDILARLTGAQTCEFLRIPLARLVLRQRGCNPGGGRNLEGSFALQFLPFSVGLLALLLLLKSLGGYAFCTLRLGNGEPRTRRPLDLRSGVAFVIHGEAFPQSENLRSQSLAGKFALETDDLIKYLTGAQPRELFRVPLAGLLLRYRCRYHLQGGLALQPLPLGLGGLAALLLLVPESLCSCGFEPLALGRGKPRALFLLLALLRGFAFRTFPIRCGESRALFFLLTPLRGFAFRTFPICCGETRALFLLLAQSGGLAFGKLLLGLLFAGRTFERLQAILGARRKI